MYNTKDLTIGFLFVLFLHKCLYIQCSLPGVLHLQVVSHEYHISGTPGEYFITSGTNGYLDSRNN